MTKIWYYILRKWEPIEGNSSHFLWTATAAHYFLRTRKSLGPRKLYNFVTSGTFLDEKLIFMDYGYVLRTSRAVFAKFLLYCKIQPLDFLWTDFCFSVCSRYGILFYENGNRSRVAHLIFCGQPLPDAIFYGHENSWVH